VAESLPKARLGYFPVEYLDPGKNIEPRQHQKAWIYERSSDPRSQVIDAVLHPAEHNVRAVLDGIAAGRPEAITAEQKLDQICTLVAG
jgi:hypothetical protein